MNFTSFRTASSCLALLAACCIGCQTDKAGTAAKAVKTTNPKAPLVCVADFELGAAQIQHEAGILENRPGPVGRVGKRLSGGTDDPAARARELVDLMANSLVNELKKAGLPARRYQSGPLPSDALLLRGVFTEVQEGNRVRRAMIGFGSGQTDIQLIAVLDDLREGAPKSLYEVATDASSGHKPGAAPTLVLSPYGAAARFVLAGHDLDKNIKKTAAEIAQKIAAKTTNADEQSRNAPSR